jgi:hypothetical protein
MTTLLQSITMSTRNPFLRRKVEANEETDDDRGGKRQQLDGGVPQRVVHADSGAFLDFQAGPSFVNPNAALNGFPMLNGTLEQYVMESQMRGRVMPDGIPQPVNHTQFWRGDAELNAQLQKIIGTNASDGHDQIHASERLTTSIHPLTSRFLIGGVQGEKMATDIDKAFVAVVTGPGDHTKSNSPVHVLSVQYINSLCLQMPRNQADLFRVHQQMHHVAVQGGMAVGTKVDWSNPTHRSAFSLRFQLGTPVYGNLRHRSGSGDKRTVTVQHRGRSQIPGLVYSPASDDALTRHVFILVPFKQVTTGPDGTKITINSWIRKPHAIPVSQDIKTALPTETIAWQFVGRTLNQNSSAPSYRRASGDDDSKCNELNLKADQTMAQLWTCGELGADQKINDLDAQGEGVVPRMKSDMALKRYIANWSNSAILETYLNIQSGWHLTPLGHLIVAHADALFLEDDAKTNRLEELKKWQQKKKKDKEPERKYAAQNGSKTLHEPRVVLTEHQAAASMDEVPTSKTQLEKKSQGSGGSWFSSFTGASSKAKPPVPMEQDDDGPKTHKKKDKTHNKPKKSKSKSKQSQQQQSAEDSDLVMIDESEAEAE